MSRALVMCSHGHLHRGASAARMCEAAWRAAQLRRDPALRALVADLRAAVERAQQRNRDRGIGS